MPCTVSFASFTLTLGGKRWRILARDAESDRIVAALGEAMSLSPARCSTKRGTGEQWREVRVFVDPGLSRPVPACYESGPVLCLLPPPKNHDLLVIGMSFIAQTIAHAELSRGGLLVHGALAAAPDHLNGGIILAGPGTVGKTTASNRLPLPWRSLSDDASLVVRDDRGYYLAHPWPTWSRFFTTPDGNLGPGGRWNVQSSLPLQAIFFLTRAEEVRIAPLPLTSAVAYLMDTVQHVSLLMTWSLPADQLQALHATQLAAAEELVRTIPAYTLHLNLTGTFWNDIEETLTSNSTTSPELSHHVPARRVEPEHKQNSAQSFLFDDAIEIVSYLGPSMHPTLRHPDLLEVLPYLGQPVRPGDIVYFHSPVDAQKVIHRVVQITENGIRTRGDNNPAADPFFLQQQDIIGRVTAAWRYGRRREIARGFRGTFAGICALLRRRANSLLVSLLHRTYHGLASSGLFRYLLPARYHPMVFEFKQQNLPSILKLMVRGKVIGRYDVWKQHWEIDRPWRLLIDASMLPVVDWAPAEDTPATEPQPERPFDSAQGEPFPRLHSGEASTFVP